MGFAPFPLPRKFDTVIHTRIHSNRANYYDKYIVYFTLKVLGIRRSQGLLAGTLPIPWGVGLSPARGHKMSAVGESC